MHRAGCLAGKNRAAAERKKSCLRLIRSLAGDPTGLRFDPYWGKFMELTAGSRSDG
jgi:hypothetical protein